MNRLTHKQQAFTENVASGLTLVRARDATLPPSFELP